MGLVNIKEVNLAPKAQINKLTGVSQVLQEVAACSMIPGFTGVAKNKLFFSFLFLFLSQVSSQHRLKHFSFQESKEPPPSVSISS